MKKTGGGGSTAKHSGTTSKHQVHHRAKTKHKNPPAKAKTPATGHGTATTVAKHPHHARARTLGDGIGLCPAEAVAAAARLAGWAVTARDVLDLYARCADGPSSGFTIAAALTAGMRLGVTGFERIEVDGAGWTEPADAIVVDSVPAVDDFLHWQRATVDCPEFGQARHVEDSHGVFEAVPVQRPNFASDRSTSELGHDRPVVDVHALILGVDLPGPHAVTVAPDGCWVSWGEHYHPASFHGAVIEEAWAVSFAAGDTRRGGLPAGESSPGTGVASIVGAVAA